MSIKCLRHLPAYLGSLKTYIWTWEQPLKVFLIVLPQQILPQPIFPHPPCFFHKWQIYGACVANHIICLTLTPQPRQGYFFQRIALDRSSDIARKSQNLCATPSRQINGCLLIYSYLNDREDRGIPRLSASNEVGSVACFQAKCI